MTPARRIPSGLLLAALSASPVSGALPAPHEAQVAKCIRGAAQGRSWLEITLWGLRDQEGGWAGAEVLNGNGSHDLGPMQINSWWVSRLADRTGAAPSDVRRWLTSDICYNVGAARWIFLTALHATGNYWSAVGAYHSPSPKRARGYAASVADKLRQRFGPAIFHANPSLHHRLNRRTTDED